MPYNRIMLYFRLPYIHVSYNASFSTLYFSTHFAQTYSSTFYCMVYIQLNDSIWYTPHPISTPTPSTPHTPTPHSWYSACFPSQEWKRMPILKTSTGFKYINILLFFPNSCYKISFLSLRGSVSLCFANVSIIIFRSRCFYIFSLATGCVICHNVSKRSGKYLLCWPLWRYYSSGVRITRFHP